MVKRKKIRLRHGDVLDVEEYHDGNYGGEGKDPAEEGEADERTGAVDQPEE